MHHSYWKRYLISESNKITNVHLVSAINFILNCIFLNILKNISELLRSTRDYGPPRRGMLNLHNTPHEIDVLQCIYLFCVCMSVCHAFQVAYTSLYSLYFNRLEIYDKRSWYSRKVVLWLWNKICLNQIYDNILLYFGMCIKPRFIHNVINYSFGRTHVIYAINM